MSLWLSQEVKKELSFSFCAPSQQNTASSSKQFMLTLLLPMDFRTSPLCGRKPDAKSEAFSPLLLTYYWLFTTENNACQQKSPIKTNFFAKTANLA